MKRSEKTESSEDTSPSTQHTHLGVIHPHKLPSKLQRNIIIFIQIVTDDSTIHDYMTHYTGAIHALLAGDATSNFKFIPTIKKKIFFSGVSFVWLQ